MTLFGPPFIYDGDPPYGLRGVMPGMLSPFEAPYAAATSSANMIAPGEIVTGVTNVPGRLVLMTSSGSMTYGDFFLLLDEDWGDI
jgi:hypothetical protein